MSQHIEQVLLGLIKQMYFKWCRCVYKGADVIVSGTNVFIRGQMGL